ncbi:4,5-dihydroxyphthalate decarboxylase [Pigmentiphaga humi]|uniref:4,5-dihydroxyphthalate decarboxylase n=1 Tax=Pigmentiphaga humi TaxID=2478468 RepID=A0A3P4B6Z8_9BURK|nr:phosphate ABC transporter substrate-binding protein [Pigmentiphaga humi]VCU70945.1 4,5-dihydroxyphthalate decarboxylase [Pigmentiphaga humi]
MNAAATAGRPIVTVNLGDYPATRAWKSGQLDSDLIDVRFSGLRAVWDEFAAMMRTQKYDCSEMSLVSYLQARALDQPFVLLPVVVTGKMQHGYIGYDAQRGPLRPKDLEGRRVGVRSHPQTTGTWARSILQNEHGVDLDGIQWICVEDPHVEGSSVPPNVGYDHSGRTMLQILLAGDVDAAVLGPDMHRDPRVQPVIADADQAAARWLDRHGIVQIIHMPVVTQALARARPDIVRELFRLYMASRAAAPEQERTAFAPHPAGVEPLRRGLQCMIDVCCEQNLLARRLTVDELFDDTTRRLGAVA